MIRTLRVFLCCMALACSARSAGWAQADLHLTGQDVLETHGLSVLLFHNSYHRVFGDQKMSGMEIILEDQRIATNGDVRLSATPAQWDPIPEFESRKRGPSPDEVIAVCSYLDQEFSYRIDVRPDAGGFRVAVQLDRPIPDALAGKAGFNLEFLPSLYFGKSYLAGGMPGLFQRHSAGPMEKTAESRIEPVPLAHGEDFVLAPEDPTVRVAIRSESGPIFLFDGRNQAQNGWFVLRTPIPAGKAGEVVVWHIRPNLVRGWMRRPVIGYNQVGYSPSAKRSQLSNWIHCS